MKYEAPELKALTPAINAIQTSGGSKISGALDSVHPDVNDSTSAYADWE